MAFTADPTWLAEQPPELATALPAPFYTERDALTLENRAVFAPSWQLVAQTGELAESGDHIVAEVGGVPVIVVRGEDGQLRAFHNVCRHRAGPIATCAGRGARALRCRYHGWTYGLDGQLRSAPEMTEAAGFDVASIRLPEISVATWHQLVFVALADAPPLRDVLAGIDERLKGRPLADYRFDRRVSYEVASNWKVYVDNFLEGYHVPHIHPALNRLLDYRTYTTDLAPWHSLQHSPLENVGNFYGDGEALYYFVYPNTMLNLLPGRMQTNRIVPLGVDRCRVDFDYYYAKPAEGDALDQRHQDQIFSDEIQREDVELCELVQQRLASGSYFAGRLSPKRESGVHHFHELLRRAYRAHA